MRRNIYYVETIATVSTCIGSALACICIRSMPSSIFPNQVITFGPLDGRVAEARRASEGSK